MPIRAVGNREPLQVDPRPRRRAPVAVVESEQAPLPGDTPATVVTFLASFIVTDARLLHEEAAKRLTRMGATDEELDGRLCVNGMVNVGECVSVLLTPFMDTMAERTKCPLVEAPETYLEPAPDAG